LCGFACALCKEHCYGEKNRLRDQCNERRRKAQLSGGPCHSGAEMPVCHPRDFTSADELAVFPKRTANVVRYFAIKKRKARFRPHFLRDGCAVASGDANFAPAKALYSGGE
jgi:hypothetical protein